MSNKATPNLTTLDFSILGLLAQNPMSGYRIRMMFEKTALASYSSSPGTIYPALKRLEKHAMVCKVKSEAKGSGLFSITPKGSDALTKWVVQPVTRNDVIRNMEILMLRFAFMDFLVPKKDKKQFLISFRDALREYVRELEDYRDTSSTAMPLSGRQAFEHGLESNRLTIVWIEKILLNL